MDPEGRGPVIQQIREPFGMLAHANSGQRGEVAVGGPVEQPDAEARFQ